MDIRQAITTEMIKRKRQERPGHEALMCLLSFGISQTRLAAELGTTVALVSCWRRGLRPVPAHWQARLYELLGECLDSRRATIRLLKREGAWDAKMARIVRTRFRAAQRIYDARPAEFRNKGQGEEAA